MAFLENVVNSVIALTLRLMLFFFSFGIYENSPPPKDEVRLGKCGHFDYLFTFSGTDYTPGSQLQYLITSGNYWGWKSCSACPEVCKEEFRGNESLHRFNMVSKNNFGDVLVPLVMDNADPYFKIVRHDDGYNVTLYQYESWVSPDVLLDRWLLRRIPYENVTYSLITSMKTRGEDSKIARGVVNIVPH
jgi:hypothetical protein